MVRKYISYLNSKTHLKGGILASTPFTWVSNNFPFFLSFIFFLLVKIFAPFKKTYLRVDKFKYAGNIWLFILLPWRIFFFYKTVQVITHIYICNFLLITGRGWANNNHIWFSIIHVLYEKYVTSILLTDKIEVPCTYVFACRIVYSVQLWNYGILCLNVLLDKETQVLSHQYFWHHHVPSHEF